MSEFYIISFIAIIKIHSNNNNKQQFMNYPQCDNQKTAVKISYVINYILFICIMVRI
jgi:hypothetical protein